jgi:hypothetical protein
VCHPDQIRGRGEIGEGKNGRGSMVSGSTKMVAERGRKHTSETDYWIFQIVQLLVTRMKQVGQTDRRNLHNFRNFLPQNRTYKILSVPKQYARGWKK